MQPVRSVGGRIALWILLVFFMLLSTLPFMWTIMQSLKTNLEASARTPILWFQPTAASYSEIWLQSTNWATPSILAGLGAVLVILVGLRVWAPRLPWAPRLTALVSVVVVVVMLWSVPRLLDTTAMYDVFLNSVVVSVATVVISLVLSSFSGYALARYYGTAAMVILLAAVALRALPRLGFVLPYFWGAQLTGLYDSVFLVIITLVALNIPFAIWLLRGFFMDIAREIEEAAMMDGASRLQAFRQVILPIAWPGIIATGLFTLLLAYQEFLLVRVITQNNTTLAVAGAQYLGGRGVASEVAIQSAAAVSATLPLLVIVLLYQKHLVKGLSAGAVKG